MISLWSVYVYNELVYTFNHYAPPVALPFPLPLVLPPLPFPLVPRVAGCLVFVKNKDTGEQYATKTNLIQSGERNQEFILREIGNLINVQHPKIVQFHSYDNTKR